MPYIYGAAANAIKWQMGFNSPFKGLISGMPKASYSFLDVIIIVFFIP
jgi:hypothetical protein